MLWTALSPRPATQRAARAIIQDLALSDARLAELASVSTTTVGR